MSLINFTVKCDLLAARTDSGDTGSDSDLVALVGDVLFTPLFTDEKPILAPSYTPRPAGFKLLPITGYLDSDGQLKSTKAGTVGVRLPANDPVLELEKLTYKVDFDLRTAYGERVRVDGGYFEAPATDGNINLIDVLQSTGAASVSNLNQILVYAHEIVDSTDVGVDLMTADTKLDARTVIDAVNLSVESQTVYSFDVDTQPLTASDVGAYTRAEVDDAIEAAKNKPVLTSPTMLLPTAQFCGQTPIGGNGAEDGASAWSKLATIRVYDAYQDVTLMLAVVAGVSQTAAADTAVVAVHAKTNNYSASPSSDVTLLGLTGTSALAADAFKLIGGAGPADADSSATFELWMRKSANYNLFRLFELGRMVSNKTSTVTYEFVAWQSAEPVGAVSNVQTSAVKIGSAAALFAGGPLGTPSSGTLTNCTFPTLNQNTTGSAATLTTSRTIQTDLSSTSSASFNGSANITPGVTGTLAVASGGTGQASRQAAINALTGTQSSGTYLRSDGTNVTLTSIQAGDVPALNYVVPGAALGTPSSGTLTNCTGLPRSAVSDPNDITTGQFTMTRREINSTGIASTNGYVRLSYFTATATQTVSQIRMYCGATAAAGTTLARAGLYEVDASTGDLTLVASIVNDTTLFGTANTSYTRSFSQSYQLTKGNRYAVGLIVSATTTAPNFVGHSGASVPNGEAPRLSGLITGQTDLPSSISASSLTDTLVSSYVALLP